MQLKNRDVEINRPIQENTYPLANIESLFPKENTAFYIHVKKNMSTGRTVLLTSCMMLNSIPCSFFVPLWILIRHFFKKYFSFDEIENVWGQFGSCKAIKHWLFSLLIFLMMGLFSQKNMLVSGYTLKKLFFILYPL